MTSILKTALEDIKKLDESLDPEDWASDESMLSITGRVIAALKEAIKNQGEPVKGAYFDGVGVVLCGIGSEKGQRLYLSAPETGQTSLPEGWQIVPKEPTPKMIHEGQMSRLCPVTGSESAASIYKAMLSAALIGGSPLTAELRGRALLRGPARMMCYALPTKGGRSESKT